MYLNNTVNKKHRFFGTLQPKRIRKSDIVIDSDNNIEYDIFKAFYGYYIY